MSMMKRVCLVAAGTSVLAVGSVFADGEQFPLDVSSVTPLVKFTHNNNDGYSSFRGVIFSADENVLVDGAALWTASANGLNARFELYSITATSGNVLAGATLEASADAFLQGSTGFMGTKFDAVQLTAGSNYLIRVGYQEAADENWFFAFEQGSVDLGPFTVIDGTLGGDSGNTVMPLMALQIVPAPGAFALLAVAGLVARRRRRS